MWRVLTIPRHILEIVYTHNQLFSRKQKLKFYHKSSSDEATHYKKRRKVKFEDYSYWATKSVGSLLHGRYNFNKVQSHTSHPIQKMLKNYDSSKTSGTHQCEFWCVPWAGRCCWRRRCSAGICTFWVAACAPWVWQGPRGRRGPIAPNRRGSALRTGRRRRASPAAKNSASRLQNAKIAHI